MIETDELKSFIRRSFLFDSEAVLADDQELFPDVIDSLGVMEVVDFIEETYGIDIPEEDLLADNFRTVAAITELIERHRP